MKLVIRTALLVLSFSGASVAQATQSPSMGRLEGTIKESGHRQPVQGASIALARLDSEPVLSFGAKPDGRGHYRLDSLPAGRYMIQLNHAVLDSLDLALPTNEVNIVAGETARAQFSLPTNVALRNAVCRGLTLAKGTGAVVGRVVDADSEQPLANADVAISWMDLSIDRKTLRSSNEEHTGWVRTGPRGEYRICNVPTGSWVLIQLQHAGRAGNALRIAVTEAEGVVVRNLSLSVQAAPTLAALDSIGATAPAIESDTSADDSARSLFMTGGATVTGIIRGTGGRPLRDVQLRVVNGQQSTRTDERGAYTLTGLPAGTQMLVVRRIGYLIGDVAVELRTGKTVNQDVELRRVVSLDSMRIIAQRARYAEFEDNRQNNAFGRFFTADQIAERRVVEVGQLVQTIAGFTVRGSGPHAKAYSNSAKGSRSNCAEANVVIDGSDRGHINYVPAKEIAGIEAYPEAAGAPGQYRAECGLIVIWTKKHVPKPRP